MSFAIAIQTFGHYGLTDLMIQATMGKTVSHSVGLLSRMAVSVCSCQSSNSSRTHANTLKAWIIFPMPPGLPSPLSPAKLSKQISNHPDGTVHLQGNDPVCMVPNSVGTLVPSLAPTPLTRWNTRGETFTTTTAFG